MLKKKKKEKKKGCFVSWVGFGLGVVGGRDIIAFLCLFLLFLSFSPPSFGPNLVGDGGDFV